MILRVATPADAPTLGRILGDWVRETGWMPVRHTREEDVGFLAMLIEKTDVTVAEDRHPLGFLSRDDDEIRALYLSADARGRGVGRALVERAKAGSPRLTAWAFQANGRALAFYAREGFHEIDRTDGRRNEEALPDVRLAWEAHG